VTVICDALLYWLVEISTKFLKEMAAPVTPAFTFIFQASLNQGQTPEDWKLANVSPRSGMFEVLSVENTDENCEFSSFALVFGPPCKFPFSFRGDIAEFSHFLFLMKAFIFQASLNQG
jgi:hypothetical protein